MKRSFYLTGCVNPLHFRRMVVFLRMGGGKFLGQELQLWEMAANRKVPLTGGPFVGSALQFSKDSKTLVSVSNWGDTIGWLDVETGQGHVKKIEVRSGLRIPYPKVFALTENKIAIGWGDGKIQLWEPKTGKKLSTLEENAGSANMWEGLLALAFSPDGTRLARCKQGSVQSDCGIAAMPRMDDPFKNIPVMGWQHGQMC